MKEHIIGIEIDKSHRYFSLMMENREDCEAAYGMLQDETSKNIMRGLLESRLNDNWEQALKPYYTHNEYFKTGLLDFSDEEVLVDAGAFTGDTIRYYKDTFSDKFKKIYSFEASAENFKLLKENEEGDDRVELHHLALGSQEGEVSFSEDSAHPYSSMIDPNGSVRVRVNSLDAVLGDAPVTFIKMDIEGAELDAVIGAKKMIQRDKPKLALSVYHLFDDLWKIQLLVHSYVPEYKFYLRYHHSSGPYEVILYATL